MDQQQKSDARMPVPREKMFQYLYRHKLKKKYRPVRPHTYANSQSLRTQQLQKQQPSGNVKKPHISKNVKARLESNLQFLLKNQNLNATRVKEPESYLSLNVKKLKGGSGSTTTITKSSDGKIQDRQRDPTKITSTVVSMQISPSSASSRLSSFQNAAQSQDGHRLMPPPDLPAKSGHTSKSHTKGRQSDALTFSQTPIPPLTSNRSSRSIPSGIVADADSFDFRRVASRNRAGQQFMSPTSSKSRQTGKSGSKKRSSAVFESPPSAFQVDNDGSFGFDDRQTQNRGVHTSPAFSDDPGIFFDDQSDANFDAEQARGWTVASDFDKQPDSFDSALQPHSRSRSSGYRTSVNLVDSFQSRTLSAHRSGRGTVQKTRIIKSSVSRVGESPFIEQIVIQKMKQKF